MAEASCDEQGVEVDEENMSIEQLREVRKNLRRELCDVTMEVAMVTETIDSDCSGLSHEESEVKERIDKLQKELEQITRLACQDHLLKYSQLGNYCQEATDQTVTEKQDQLTANSRTHMDKLLQISNMESELRAKQEEHLQLLETLRKKYKALSLLEGNTEGGEGAEKSEKIKKRLATKKKGELIFAVVNKIFLNVIHGSEVNWSEDEELLGIVVELGKNLESLNI